MIQALSAVVGEECHIALLVATVLRILLDEHRDRITRTSESVCTYDQHRERRTRTTMPTDFCSEGSWR
jgi:hypothetical protein